MRDIPVENTAPPIGVTQGRPALLAKRWMVSSSHYLASQAGARMFERGGNAVDAGVAAGIALNVLERRAIRELAPGTLEGGADPRRESYAIGW